ncbi:hypothetical protein F2Q69_00044156 [Brassica cretica]|uniref:Uncharacterized protein n=1 Tax=Brassica cretica TaxID=69181 RepID=A0A8S9NL93_BRACR|nr:hypothetical protein F2Q69_00044156 [Brassica cretica]
MGELPAGFLDELPAGFSIDRIFRCLFQPVAKLTSVDRIFRCLFQPVAKDKETFVLAAHCMEIVGHMDVYASGALYGDCGVQRRLYCGVQGWNLVLAAHRVIYLYPYKENAGCVI